MSVPVRAMLLGRPSGRRIRSGSLLLGIAATLAGSSHCLAQTLPGRLTVRPHAMATGTQNVRAGLQRLDSLQDVWVYVPQRAVGTRRVPLLVVIPSAGRPETFRKLADTSGIILLWANEPYSALINRLYARQLTIDPALPTLVRGAFDDQDTRKIDAALKYVLRTYAIDPDKIALTGNSNGGGYALFLGCNNLDVFSRIAPVSPNFPFDGGGPQNTTTQFFLLGGLKESGFFLSALQVAQRARRDGHRVRLILTLRSHVEDAREYDVLVRWLQESWTPSGTADRAARSVAEPLPVLTPKALASVTALWHRLQQEPDSITTMLHTQQKQIPILVGQDQAVLLLEDLPALATRYPSVAADLRAAGLTARQAERYRIALISARATALALERNLARPLAVTSVLAKNVAFVGMRPDALRILGLIE